MTVQHVSFSADRPGKAHDTDLIVMGGGADHGLGSALTALVLGRQGHRIVVVDAAAPPATSYLSLTQAHRTRLDRLGLPADLLASMAGPGSSLARVAQAVRAAWPANVRQMQAGIAHIHPDRLTPQVRLADGSIVNGRLIVAAGDPGEAVMALLGLRRYLMSAGHGVRVSLSLRTADGAPFPAAVQTRGERAGDGVGLVRLLAAEDEGPDRRRLDLFLYDRPDSARLSGFAGDPRAALADTLPRFMARLPEIVVTDPVIQVVDLYDVTRPARSSLVLIGDARRNSCPAAGTGLTRLLADLAGLRDNLPGWLAEGADMRRLVAFYGDEDRRRRDEAAWRRAVQARHLALDTSLPWRLRRLMRNRALPVAASHPTVPAFAAGQVVRVRSAVEILRSLDGEGRLEGLPFMPEMAARIGQPARIRSRAGRTCVEGEGLRGMDNTVFLDDARCDGSAHAGCQRGCDTFWKTAWLNPDPDAAIRRDAAERKARLRLLNLVTRRGEQWLCQSTALKTASRPLSQMHLGQLLREVRQGDMRPVHFAQLVLRAALNKLRRRLGLADLDLVVGEPGKKSRGALDLKPGDWVRIRDIAAIRATLGPDSCNLGLTFEPEMTLAIGQVRQVDQVVTRMIHEVSGRMITLSRTVTLKGLVCEGVCSKRCPRANPLFWREAWLERVPAPGQSSDSSPAQS